MNELIGLLVQKVGLDEATARKVFEFLKAHAADVPKWLSGDMAEAAKGALGGVLGGLMGGEKK